MTWQAPDPYSAPGHSDFAPHGAPLPQAGYVSAPGGGPIPQPAAAAPQLQQSPVSRDGVPTSMWLNLPGAAGEKIAIYELDKSRPVLVIDGVRAKRDMNGNFKIAMADGTSHKLNVKATVPGFPTITFKGVVLYRSPRPPKMWVVAYMFAAIGALVMVGGWLGWLLGALAGVGAGYGAAAWLRSTDKRTLPYAVLLSGGILGVAIGVLGVVVNVRLRSR